MGIIQQLRSAGNEKLGLDFRQGHATDLSPNGNNVASYTGSAKLGDGYKYKALLIRGDNPVAYATITNAASLNLTDNYTILYYLKPYRGAAYSFDVHWTNNKYAFSHSSDHYLCFTNSGVADYQSTVVSASSTDNQIAQIGYTKTGDTVDFYERGAKLGVTKAVTSPTAPTGNYTISSATASGTVDYYGVFIYNIVLTATQIQQHNVEFWATVYDTKPYSKTVKNLKPLSAQPNCVLAVDGMVGVTPFDVSSNNYALTLSGSVTQENTPLGIAYKFKGGATGAPYISCTTNPFNAVSATAITIETWLNTSSTSFDGAVQLIMDDSNGSEHSGGFWFGVDDRGGANPTNALRCSYRCAANDRFVIAANAFPGTGYGWYKVAVVINPTDARIYINGVDATTTVGITGGSFQPKNATLAIGSQNNGTVGFVGSLLKPQLYSYAKTVAQIKADYEKDKQGLVQFQTGFGATQSVAAEGGTIGQFISNTPFQCSDTTGRFQVTTDTFQGSLVKVLKCTTAGLLYLPSSYFGTSAESAYGNWKIYWQAGINATSYIEFIDSKTNSTSENGYFFSTGALAPFAFGRRDNGSSTALKTTANSYWTAGVYHKINVSRTTAGIFSFLVDNVKPFTDTTDTTYTTSNYFVLAMTANDKIILSDVGGNYSLTKSYFA